jgi:hypothetical protein
MKILFATVPADGHFNPLTSVAMHLKAVGHDVRWYAGPSYSAKLERLGIPCFPFVRATQVDASNIGELFPERAKLHGLALIRFDGNHFFVADVGNNFEDVRDIHTSFPFDVLCCDVGFFALQLIKEELGKRVCAFGVAPSFESSSDVPPNLLGLKPARTAVVRLAHRGLRAMMNLLVMNDLRANYNTILAAYGLPPIERAVCRALLIRAATPTPR